MSRFARNSDPHTSWAAAYQADPDADRTLQATVLSALINFGPMTHADLVELINRARPASPSGVRTRVRELVDAGKVEACPHMIAKSEYGRASLLWRAVR